MAEIYGIRIETKIKSKRHWNYDNRDIRYLDWSLLHTLFLYIVESSRGGLGFGERENEYEGHKFTILRSEYAEIYGIRF